MTEPSSEVAVVEPAPSVDHAAAALLAPDLESYMRLAQVLAQSQLIPKPLRGKPQDVLLVLLAGREIGIQPVQALNQIHVIEGKPTIAAELMRALVFKRGHTVTVDVNDERAVVSGKRSDSGTESSATFTMVDAQRAGLEGKENWRKYPRSMMSARATSALCRELFPDVISGVSYTAEELEVTQNHAAPALGPHEPAGAAFTIEDLRESVLAAVSREELTAVWHHAGQARLLDAEVATRTGEAVPLRQLITAEQAVLAANAIAADAEGWPTGPPDGPKTPWPNLEPGETREAATA